MMQTSGSTRGFTLLEVLIAIVITSLIGLGSWQLLSSAIRTNEKTQLSLERLAALQKTMLFIARDLRQVVPRAIRNEFGDYAPALSSKSDFYRLEFSRVGWRNPLADSRSELQRVAYELDEEGNLVRHYWRVMDRDQDSEARHRTLLEGLDELEIQFLNQDDGWLDEWPASDTDSASPDRLYRYNHLPRAIRVRFKHPNFGELERLFELPAYIEANSAAGTGNNGNTDGEHGNAGDNSGSTNDGSSGNGSSNDGSAGNGEAGDSQTTSGNLSGEGA